MNCFFSKSRTARVCFLLPVLVLSSCLLDEEPPKPSESLESALQDTAMAHAVKHLDPKYVCPMHPQIVKDEEGSCPICGMDLVEKMIDPDQGKGSEVKVGAAIVQSMGVRTGYAKHETLWKYIRTIGRIEYDETRIEHVHPRAAGWMEKLALRAEGEPVKRGQLIGEFYSPDILNAQVDFLIALEQPGKKRYEKARNRLRLLGVTEGTISRIQKRRETQNRIPVYAPADGVVTKLMAREGMYVMPEMEMITTADLSKVWVMVDVFEHQIDWLREGLTAEIEVPAYPGRSWQGKVDYLYPELDPGSRTLKVRLVFDNPDGLLKANMFAEVVIYGGPKENALVIPTEALIITGERTSVVQALGEGRFQPLDVVTGMSRGGKTEILSGLKQGDEIVTSGQFLIDSEASLRASFSRMGN